MYCESVMTVDSSLRQSVGGFISTAVVYVTAIIILIFLCSWSNLIYLIYSFAKKKVAVAKQMSYMSEFFFTVELKPIG